jgi:hypothetical protein
MKKKEDKDTVALPTAQTDELQGLVQIHYGIVDDYFAAIQTVTDFKKAQSLMHWAVYKNIYGPTDAKSTAAKSKASIDLMIDSDDFPCAKLNKDVGAKVRKQTKKLGVDNSLFCSLLKYGVVLSAAERQVTKGWLWNSAGSSANSKNSIQPFYDEIWPKDNDHLEFVKAQVGQFKKVKDKIKPTDWTGFDTITETVAVPGSKATKTFTRNVPKLAITDSSAADPSYTARRLFQVLAMDSKAIESTLQNNFPDKVAQFKMSKITITGFIGATFSGGRGGYCTNDGNKFQVKFTKTYDWAPADGFKAGNWDGQLWFAAGSGSWFQFQLTIPMQTVRFWTDNKRSGGNADNPWVLRFYMAFASSFTTKDKAPVPTGPILQSIATPLMDMVSQFYTQWKMVKNAKEDELMSTFSKAVLAIMDKKNVSPVLTALQKGGLIKTPDLDAGDKFKNALKTVGAAATKVAAQALMAVLGLETNTLLEVGISANIHKEGTDWKFAPSVDVASTILSSIKMNGGKYVFYLIQGTTHEVKPAAQILK